VTKGEVGMHYQKKYNLNSIKKVDIKVNLHRPTSLGWHLVSQISPEQSSLSNSENSTTLAQKARGKMNFFNSPLKRPETHRNYGVFNGKNLGFLKRA
jgi:hypothetical protein